MLQLKILLQQRSKISKILRAATRWSQINQCFLKICRVWGLWGYGEIGRDQVQKWLSGFWLTDWDVGVIFRDWEPEKMWKVLTGTAKGNLGSSCWKWCWFQPRIFPHFQLAHSLLSLGIYLNVCISAKIFLSTISGIWCHPHPCVLHCLPWLYSFFFFFLPHLSPSDIIAYLCDGLPPLQSESYESKELCPFCSQLRTVPGIQSALRKYRKSEWMNEWWMPSRDCDGSLWFWPETVLSLDSVILDETVLALEAVSRRNSGRGKQGAGVRRNKESLNFVCDLCAQLLSHVQLFVTPWAVAWQAPLSMGILQARILEWIAIPFSRGIFSIQGSNLCLLHLLHWQVDSLPLCCLVSPQPPFPYL